MAKFVFKVGKEETQREGDRVSIGTRSTCSFTLDDPLAADVHCDVVLRGDEFVIIDRGTSLGTYVSGLQVEAPRVLKDGDEIVIAVSRIKVKIKDDQINLEVEKARFFYDDKTDALDLSRREVTFGRFRPVSFGNWLVTFAMLLLFPLCYLGTTSDVLLEPGPTWHSGQQAFHDQAAGLADGHDGCNACHSPFDGNLDTKCMTCHKEDIQQPAQHPASSLEDWGKGCNHCHVDHRGSAEGALMAKTAQETCGDCHKSDRKMQGSRSALPDAIDVAIGYNTFAHADHFGKKLDPNGTEIACNDCHVSYADGTPMDDRAKEGDRVRQFQPVDYQKCLECHSKTAPTARAFEPSWHGVKPTEANGEKGGHCLECHAEVNSKDLKMIADFDAVRDYALVTRSHGDQLVSGHKMADGRACTDCHRNGEELRGNVEVPAAKFAHGVHIFNPWPADPGAMLAGSGDPNRPRGGECVQCHIETAKSSSLLTAEAQHYANQNCVTCHTSATPRETVTSTPAGDRPDFPHSRHLKVDGGCFACHVFPNGDLALTPETPEDVRSCMKCHQEHDSIAGGHCDDCHKSGDPALSAKPLMVARNPDRNYDHMSPGHRDWTEEGRCVDCHGADIWEKKSIADIKNPGEDAPACRQCHVEEKGRFHWR